MKIFQENIENLSGAVLVLGFFDGIHLGHKKVISAAVDYAKKNNSKTVVLTFSASPAEYFGKNTLYIYSRDKNFKLIDTLGIDYVVQTDFYKLADITADDYLKTLVKNYSPIAIFTGENHTFGHNKLGTPKFLQEYSEIYGYDYFCIKPVEIDGNIVSSTGIKELLVDGNVELANKLLDLNFSLGGKVVTGMQMGRAIGFPTANINYPEKIVKLPYGVYRVKTLGRNAILNWGVKPTVGKNKEILEVHIPNFDDNLYDQILDIEFIKRIRAEKKFNSLGELKIQILKDLEECLKS